MPLVQHAADDLLIDWSPDGRTSCSRATCGTTDAWLLPVKEGPSGHAAAHQKDLVGSPDGCGAGRLVLLQRRHGRA
jgi:hypothetical protein